MIALAQGDDSALRFPSLASLRVAHGELLRRQRQDPGAAGLRAQIEAVVRRGQATGAMLDEADDRAEAQGILDYWATQLFRVDRTAVDATLDDFDAGLAPKLDDDACPYVGLDAFRQTSHGIFFGRERLVDSVLQRLSGERFLAVVGASGSGKSSLVLAGVLPALQKGALAGSASWRVLPPLVPGSKPLTSLAGAFAVLGGADAGTAAMAARLREDPSYLLTLAGSKVPCVLTIDQFEEAFTLCDDEAERQALAAALVALVEARGPRHTVLLTLRSDYESRVAQLGRLQDIFESGQVRVMPLGAAELREAIVRPAELVGLKFETGVVDALLRDILGEPAGLPLLQFTLLKLWQNRERNRVTWESYRQLGGGRLALAHSADSLFDSFLPQDQFTARRILLRMVRTNEGLEVTSSRVRREDLYRGGEDPGRIDQVLHRLAEARLVRLTRGQQPTDDQVEVAHEALVRNWPRLVEWLQEEASEIATRRRLEALVEEWIGLDKHAGLLDAVQLREAERWLRSPSADLLGYHWELPNLVDASRQALGEAARRAEAARQRELERARQLADAEGARAEAEAARAEAEGSRAEAERARAEGKARSTRRFRAAAVIMGLLLIVTLLLGGRYLASERRLAANEKRLSAAQQAIQTAELRLAQSQTDREKRARQEAESARQRAEEQTRLKEEAVAELTEKTRLLEEKTAELERALEEQRALKARADQEAANARTAERLATAQTEEKERALAELRQQTQLTEEARSANAQRRSTEPILSVLQLPELADRARPLRIGASIGLGIPSPAAGTGSICCFVRDAADKRYLLSTAGVLGAITGAPVLQPGNLDGGTLSDRVGIVAKIGPGGKYNSGAIARLDESQQFLLEIPGIGRIQGLERTVQRGDAVRLVGRGSGGIVSGKVLKVDDKEIVTDIVPKPGDAGGAILSADNELVGLLNGSDGKQSFVLPIVPILRSLGVELIRE